MASKSYDLWTSVSMKHYPVSGINTRTNIVLLEHAEIKDIQNIVTSNLRSIVLEKTIHNDSSIVTH